MTKDKIIDVCDDFNKCTSVCKPMTKEDRRRGIAAYKYDIQLQDDKQTQKQVTRAEHFEIGEIVTCLDTGFKAEILTRLEIKDQDMKK